MLQEYGLSKETFTAIMMLYRKTKAKICSLDGDTDFVNIVAGILQGDTLAPYLFIIYLDNELWTSIDFILKNDFTLKKIRSREDAVETMTDVDNADDLELLVNTPPQPNVCCIA